MPLTDKQTRFVAEYLIDTNATQAAIRCGYSRKTAKQQGTRLLSNAVVKAAIRRAQARTLGKLELTAERVLQELARVAFSTVQDHFDRRGALIPLHKLPPAASAAIASYDIVL